MVVGVLRLSLSIPAASSLKDKRQVVRKITDRIRGRFDVAVAEVGENDIWQRTQLGVVAVGNDRRFVNEVLDKVRGFVDELYLAPILDQELELMSYGPDRFGELSLKDAVTAAQWADHRVAPASPPVAPASPPENDPESNDE
jgi:uncharacterized protein YlxP (DUF503 family)